MTKPSILVPKQDPYPWMQNACYEPPPIPFAIQRRRHRIRMVFWILAILAIICGALVGWNH